MATIENRSRFIVTVANRDDLLKTFPHSKRADAMAYVRQLSTEYGFKPKLSRENNSFIARFREVGFRGLYRLCAIILSNRSWAIL